LPNWCAAHRAIDSVDHDAIVIVGLSVLIRE
jgi:hypothetical protein